jgi:hypothetical protein
MKLQEGPTEVTVLQKSKHFLKNLYTNILLYLLVCIFYFCKLYMFLEDTLNEWGRNWGNFLQIINVLADVPPNVKYFSSTKRKFYVDLLGRYKMKLAREHINNEKFWVLFNETCVNQQENKSL